MPINSSASSATIDRVSRFQENATVNFAIKADSLEKICKVSAFEMLTETRHRQATCHDVQSTVLSVRQKENSNSLSSPIVTRIGDKAAKCQTQRQPGVVHKPRLHNEFLKSCPESPRRVHVCGCLSGICSWIRLLCCFASIRRQFSTCIANITHIVHLAFLRVANQSQHSEITLYAFITFLSSLCFLNSLNGEFVHDDIPALVQNPDVLGITSIVELFTHDFWGRPMADIESHKSYRPITTLTFR